MVALTDLYSEISRVTSESVMCRLSLSAHYTYLLLKLSNQKNLIEFRDDIFI